MSQTHLELDDDRSVTRLHNRALRSVNRGLRRLTERLKEHGDELFIELCNTNVAAEQAMWRLWQEGGFQPPCGPEDYDFIVDASIRALRESRDAQALEPAAQSK